MRCDAGSLVLRKVDSNKHTHTQWHTSRSVACGGVNKAQSVARVSASVTNSSPANAAHSASSSPHSTFCLSLLCPYFFLPPFLYPPCRCLRHCRAYQQHNLSWRVPQFPALLRSISLSFDFQFLLGLFCRILWANSPRRCCLSHAFAITNIVLCAQQTSPSMSTSSLAFRVLPRPPRRKSKSKAQLQRLHRQQQQQQLSNIFSVFAFAFALLFNSLQERNDDRSWEGGRYHNWRESQTKQSPKQIDPLVARQSQLAVPRTAAIAIGKSHMQRGQKRKWNNKGNSRWGNLEFGYVACGCNRQQFTSGISFVHLT